MARQISPYFPPPLRAHRSVATGNRDGDVFRFRPVFRGANGRFDQNRDGDVFCSDENRDGDVFHSDRNRDGDVFRIRPVFRGGFTLVEVLAVVVILGIASAMVMPYLGTRNDQYVQAAARVAMADLIYAQNQAIVTQTTQYVQFDTTAQTYSLLTASPATSPLVYATNPTSTQNYLRKFNSSTTPQLQNVTLNTVNFDGKTTMAFDELGQPLSWDPATNTTAPFVGTGTIVLQSGTFSMTVSVEPYTANFTAH